MNNFGKLFEFCFNLGVLSHFKEKKFFEFNKINLNDILTQLLNDVDDINLKNIYKENISYLIFKGFESGRSFINEFVNSKIKSKKYELFYFKSNLIDPFDKNDKDFHYNYYKKDLKERLGIDLSKSNFIDFSKKGEFLKADCIVVIKNREKYYFLCVDNSMYIKNIETNYSDISSLKNKLIKNSIRKKSKSSFNNLQIDSKGFDYKNIDDYFLNYLTIFNGTEKGFYKSIQAGSYMNSFIKFLVSKNKLEIKNIESITLTGYTDEDFCNINISKDEFLRNKEILEKFSNAYKDNYNFDKDKVFKNISYNFRKSFNLEDSFKFINNKDEKNIKTISFIYDDFQNTAGNIYHKEKNDTLRNIHKEEIKTFLKDRSIQNIFLTANAGIGKTTSISEYLKDEESYIFFYISPRIQVNKEIKDKFISIEPLTKDDLVILSATSLDEEINEMPTVSYISNNSKNFRNINTPIKFIDSKNNTDFTKKNNYYKNTSQKDFTENQKSKQGVLKRLSTATNYVIEKNLSRKIVITASIQSLKAFNKNDTSINIKKIFSSFLDKDEDILQNDFVEFSKKYKNVFFMIDEVTGDSAGSKFLSSLNRIIFDEIYDNLENKDLVNFKLIVADASITNEEIINTHFNEKNDIDKIYYKELDKEVKSLESNLFNFKNKYKSVCINASSYPAKSLETEYIVVTQNEVNYNEKDFSLYKKANEIIVDECLEKNNYQTIIYIQNKERLEEIKKSLQGKYLIKYNKELKKNEDFITINADISEAEKNNISLYKDKVKFVFMTSSASRGLSFKNVNKILVDISNFNIEQNLMEIMQVVYRGRGDSKLDLNLDKKLKFYIKNRVLVNDEEIKIKSNLSVMSIILIIKMAIETRIYGYSKFINKNIALIPLGSKYIESVENNFILSLSSINKRLNKEILKNYDYNLIEVRNSIDNILSKIDIETKNTIFNKEFRNFNDIRNKFYEIIKKDIYLLLDFNPVKSFCIIGDLVIFKSSDEVNMKINLLNDVIFNELEKNLLNKILRLIMNNNTLDNTKSILNKIYYLLKHYIDNEKGSMNFNLIDKKEDFFVAFALANILFENEFIENFKNKDEEYKDVLVNFIRSYFSLSGILPIGINYFNLGYIAFRSSNLEPIRKNSFNESYMLVSSEINMINLILMKNN